VRDNNIKIEPFEIVKLLALTGKQRANQHGEVSFSGVIPMEKEMEYLAMGFRATWVKISVLTKDGEEGLWFQGVLTSLEIESDRDVKVAHITAKTGTYLMDSALHTRSYQLPSLTYENVLASYTSDYPNSDFMMTEGKGETINGLIMQYRETDWEYTKRLASHFNTAVVPDFKAGGVKYYFGIPNGVDSTVVNTGTYTAKRDMEEYQYKSERGVGLSELDTTYYLLRSRDIYNLCDKIILNDRPLYISRIETQFEGQEMYHYYYLKTLTGFKVPKEYNTSTIGASFYSKILDVERDQVKISINNDENKDSCGERWFSYSTVYSSPDGTGWYAMPEIGDCVRLYVPTEDESGAYVISSTHLETPASSASGERVNPDYKSIMNKYKKEILFTPNSLIITNNDGMSIQLLDEEGIKIISDKSIHIQSEEAINMVSTQDNITVMAPDKILFQQGDVVTQLEENISFRGAQVHLD
jgi:hypothetical protein